MESAINRRARPVHAAFLNAIVDRRSNGVTYMRSPRPLGEYPARRTDRLEYRATRTPQRRLLAQHGADGAWETTTCGAALKQVRRLAQGLLNQGLSADKPLMILSGNGVERGLLALAAKYVGIPYPPIAPAFSLAVKEFNALSQLQSFAAASTGSSARIERAILLDVPPSLEAQEITDKGSINQKTVLRNRTHLVEHLYREQLSENILTRLETPR